MHAEPAATTANLFDTLVRDLGNSFAALAAIFEAETLCAYLAPGSEQFRESLVEAGIAIGTPEQADNILSRASDQPEINGLPGLVPLGRPAGAPTDIVDLAVEITHGDGRRLLVLELRGVPAYWAARHRVDAVAPLLRLVGSQVRALAQGPALLARPMLALASQLQEFDSAVISQAFFALLRVLAGESPSQVEATALRISGLADTPTVALHRHPIALNEVGHQVLRASGFGQGTQAARSVPVQDPETSRHKPLAPSEISQPFARLRLIERDFVVCDDAVTGGFFFRSADNPAEPWQWLTNGPGDGWTAVAAEILERIIDVVREFARMNAIRRRDLPTDEIAEAYQLESVIWWLRPRDGGYEARLDGSDWQAVPAGDDASPKTRAIDALFNIDPAIQQTLSPPARDWANRMAHTVQVSPIISFAAE